MKNTVIITAGGSGKRMQSQIPKQFLELNGLPVLMHTMQQFIHYDADIKIILSLPEEWISYWKELCTKYCRHFPHQIVSGGKERFFSVRNALQFASDAELIAVHDGVRPLIDQKTIAEAFETAREKGAAVPVCDIGFSLRQITDQRESGRSVNREEFKEVQTPQVFRGETLHNAYRQDYQKIFTDDASVVEYSGKNVYLCSGDRRNIKITTPQDLLLAELLLKHKKGRK